MSYDIGRIIKYYRTGKNITLQSLSDGICSVSYLSKIENGYVNYGEGIVDLLLKKLGVPVNGRGFQIGNQQIEEQLEAWYTYITEQKVEDATDLMIKLEEQVNNSININTKLDFSLYKLRYLLLRRDLKEIKPLLEELSKNKDVFDNKQKYFFNKFFGLYEYIYGQLSKAKVYFDESINLLERINRCDKEKADLYFMVALNENKLFNTNLGIHYTKMALNIFNETYQIKRSADCHIMLALSFKRFDYFVEAEKHFEFANSAASAINNESIKAMCNHNIGDLHTVKKDFEIAVTYFLRSYTYKQNATLKSKLITIISIIEAFDKLDNSKEIKKWVDKGLLLVGESHQEDALYMVYILQIYELLIHERFDEFEAFLKKLVIPFFIEKEMHQYVANYSSMLSEYYQDRNKYKDACYYQGLSNQSLRYISKIG